MLESGLIRQPCAIEHSLCIKVAMGEEKSIGSQREAYKRPLPLCCYGQDLLKTKQLFAGVTVIRERGRPRYNTSRIVYLK